MPEDILAMLRAKVTVSGGIKLGWNSQGFEMVTKFFLHYPVKWALHKLTGMTLRETMPFPRPSTQSNTGTIATCSPPQGLRIPKIKAGVVTYSCNPSTQESVPNHPRTTYKDFLLSGQR